MITKVQRGRHVRGLLEYLYGPGKANEHTDPHVVAGFAPASSLEPETHPSWRRGFTRLVSMMEAPVHAADVFDAKHVWHCSVAIKPEDGVRTDEEWAQVARAIVAETGIAPDGDPNGCAWVAVRHGVSTGGNDHIHIVATLAHPDGTREKARNDYYAAGRVATRFEREWGITRTEGRDGTAAVEPTRAEREKAARRERAAGTAAGRDGEVALTAAADGPVSARVRLREAAQNAAAGASDFESFKDALEADGVLVFPRMSTRHEGEVTGYSLALPGDVNADGDPVRFGGGRLTADLSLPALHRRWASSERWAGELRVASREQLVATMRDCASTSTTPHEYLEQLRERGVLVRERYSQRRGPAAPGGASSEVGGVLDGGDEAAAEVTGYAVAMPPRTPGEEPVWLSAGHLDGSLTWPQLERQARAGGAFLRDTSSGPGARRTAGLGVLERELRASVLARAVGAPDIDTMLEGLRADGLIVDVQRSAGPASDGDAAGPGATGGEVTGYSVGRADVLTPDGQVRMVSARALGVDLTPRRLEAAWRRGDGPADRFDPSETAQLQKLTPVAIARAAQRVRDALDDDSVSAAGVAAGARDLLETLATAAGKQNEADSAHDLRSAARVFDRTSRDLDRAPAPATAVGSSLRVAALFLAGASRAGEHVELAQVVINTLALVEALSALRAAQQRHGEAVAASAAATFLRRDVERRAAVSATAPEVATRTALEKALEKERAKKLQTGTPPTYNGREEGTARGR